MTRADLDKNPADVAAMFDDVAKHGGRPIMWKTGHSLIKTKMKETGAPLAGEMSGHIFFADGYYGFDDGVYAAVASYGGSPEHPTWYHNVTKHPLIELQLFRSRTFSAALTIYMLATFAGNCFAIPSVSASAIIIA
mgnify:CR=1 FL=1